MLSQNNAVTSGKLFIANLNMTFGEYNLYLTKRKHFILKGRIVFVGVKMVSGKEGRKESMVTNFNKQTNVLYIDMTRFSC